MDTNIAGPRIAIAAITASKTNPRKRFDQAALDELADSIKRHDVLQPILLRPNGGPDTYELVAGERRFRAAKAAGLVDIPATVRELSDAEVLEIQVVENLQRKDLHELEEAEGYEALLKCSHLNGERYTVEEIAAKVGKSRSYVFARLKLCALCPEARKAFYAGELDASRALLIARIGHHDTQRQALKDVTKGEYGRGEMSYREAHQHILNTYMLKLSSAPFDTKDAGLLVKAGACGPCPKRTGNQADLFGDVKSADVCTDPKCFDDKRQAHYSIAAKALEVEGFKVITGEAARKLLPGWDHRRDGSTYLQINGYQRLEDSTYATGRTVKVGSLLGRDFKPVKLQHPLTGEIFDVASSQAIATAATKAKKASPASGARKAGGPRVRAPSPEEILSDRVFAAILHKLPDEFVSRSHLVLVARELLGGLEHEPLVADHFFPLKTGKKHDHSSARRAMDGGIEKLDHQQLSKLILACAVSSRVSFGLSKEQAETAKLFRVDVAAVKKAIADEAKVAAAKAKEEAAAKRKPAAAPRNKTKSVESVIAKLIKPMAPAVDVIITPLIKPTKKPAAKRKPAAPSFMKPMKPSEQLAAIVGDKAMPKTEVTSKLWGYIKKNDLQDRTNRRMINADEKLLPIFKGKKQVSMFDMTKLVAKHLS